MRRPARRPVRTTISSSRSALAPVVFNSRRIDTAFAARARLKTSLLFVVSVPMASEVRTLRAALAIGRHADLVSMLIPVPLASMPAIRATLVPPLGICGTVRASCLNTVGYLREAWAVKPDDRARTLTVRREHYPFG